MSRITRTWTTVATVGYTGSVSRDENRAAHGGVCHLQARQTADGLRGRRVNTNGWHSEVGESFDLDADTLGYWISIDRQSR